MKVLFDTHTLIWAVTDQRDKLSDRTVAIIADERNTILVSAASAWEIATKVRNGKLHAAEPFERNFLTVIETAGYTLLAIDTAVALRAARFASSHLDPFDRILAAQALAEDIPILSLDRKLDSFAVRRIW